MTWMEIASGQADAIVRPCGWKITFTEDLCLWMVLLFAGCIMESLGKYHVLDGGLATELILQHHLAVTVMH